MEIGIISKRISLAADMMLPSRISGWIPHKEIAKSVKVDSQELVAIRVFYAVIALFAMILMSPVIISFTTLQALIPAVLCLLVCYLFVAPYIFFEILVRMGVVTIKKSRKKTAKKSKK